MTQPAILINLHRCTGCWSCAMACKMAYELPDEEWWMFVRQMGRAGQLDEPVGTWPNISMSWLPIHTMDCTLCADRTTQGEQPYCVFNCPNLAMTFGDMDDKEGALNQEVEKLRSQGFFFTRLPPWERTREEIIYADKC